VRGDGEIGFGNLSGDGDLLCRLLLLPSGGCPCPQFFAMRSVLKFGFVYD
jgi:hypothetical protein